jgi:hypothetical protein
MRIALLFVLLSYASAWAQLGLSNRVDLEAGKISLPTPQDLGDFSLAFRVEAGAAAQSFIQSEKVTVELTAPNVLRAAIGKAELKVKLASQLPHSVAISVKRDARQALSGLWVDGAEVASTNVPPGPISTADWKVTGAVQLYSRALSRPEVLQWSAAGEVKAALAVVGGSEAVALMESGYLEALWPSQGPVRSLAWEGDTIFRQDRPLNFGTLADQFKRIQPGSVLVMLGRQECLESGADGIEAFQQKLSAAVKEWATKGWLIGPLPFEKKPAPLPDLSARNELLKRYQSVIETVAKANGLGFIDLLSAWPKDAAGWTRDGVQLTDAGTQLVAKLMAQQLSGVAPPAEINPKLLKLIREKNLLWHDYWRPTNWAFLYGDRTVQPSSRDHMNPNVRWFPQELENYRALIAAKENEMMKEQDANGRKLP